MFRTVGRVVVMGVMRSTKTTRLDGWVKLDIAATLFLEVSVITFCGACRWQGHVRGAWLRQQLGLCLNCAPSLYSRPGRFHSWPSSEKKGRIHERRTTSLWLVPESLGGIPPQLYVVYEWRRSQACQKQLRFRDSWGPKVAILIQVAGLCPLPLLICLWPLRYLMPLFEVF